MSIEKFLLGSNLCCCFFSLMVKFGPEVSAVWSKVFSRPVFIYSVLQIWPYGPDSFFLGFYFFQFHGVDFSRPNPWQPWLKSSCVIILSFCFQICADLRVVARRTFDSFCWNTLWQAALMHNWNWYYFLSILFLILSLLVLRSRFSTWNVGLIFFEAVAQSSGMFFFTTNVLPAFPTVNC